MTLLDRLQRLAGRVLPEEPHFGMPIAPPRFVQILTATRASAYLVGRTISGFLPHHVQGVFLRADHLGPTPNPASLRRQVAGLWKDASGVDVDLSNPDGSMLILQFDVDDDSDLVTLPREVFVKTRNANPTSTTSFTSWYRSHKPLHLLPGATIAQLHPDGSRTQLARLEITEAGDWSWLRIKSPFVTELATLSSFHQMFNAKDEADGIAWHHHFVDVKGWVPVQDLDARRSMVVASDRRVLRLRLANQAEQSGVCPEGAWVLVDRSRLNNLFMTTQAVFNDVDVTVQSMRPSSSGEWLVGVVSTDGWTPKINPDEWSGDEIGGFHAETTLNELDHVRVDQKLTGPSLSPLPFPVADIKPNVARTPNWVRDFLVDRAGAVFPVDVDPTTGVISAVAPDPRAADIMFPGHGRVINAERSGTRVEMPAAMGRLVQAHTRASLFDKPSLFPYIIGEDGLRYRYRNAPKDPSVDPMSMPPRAVEYRAVGTQIDSLVDPGTW
ncbi:hypothetical protein [Schaalia vaccimaxillae]|uniref:hypothetical protein n=1 Tax=Schaalia vaccimaxillae TaxID=183916 RepID=UPI0003B580B2|nr:hypothetical protein [Schaalia vaccimaxillae]